VELEFSTDYGEKWHPLVENCLPGQCNRKYNPTPSTFQTSQFEK
jgi:hypothetical protein